MRWPFAQKRDDKLDGLAHVLSATFQAKAAAETRRWDKEWMRYFSMGKDYWFYFWDLSGNACNLTAEPDEIAKLPAEKFFRFPLYKTIRGRGWVDGKDLVGKDVLEIGCGPGVFGRVTGRFAKSYTGVDVSKIALSIADLTSPKSCKYFHLYDPGGIESLAKSQDVCVGRHFFIHHNYEDSLWLLRFLRDLTRDGGLIIADFFCDPATVDGKRRLDADADLQEKYPSAMYNFEDADVERIAKDAGLQIEKIEHRPEYSNRFVRFRV